jgi:hypothetical protein
MQLLLYVTVVFCLVVNSICFTSDIDENKSEDCGCGSNLERDSVLDGKRLLTSDEKASGIGNEAAPLAVSNDNMVYIPGGRSIVGSNDPKLLTDGEFPKRIITLSSFLIDIYEVPNAGEIRISSPIVCFIGKLFVSRFREIYRSNWIHH